MLNKLRNRAQDEKGFTLIELLVVILIIGILAAIALPAFLNQRGKAQDTEAKSQVRTMQTAEETYYTDEQTYRVPTSRPAGHRAEPDAPVSHQGRSAVGVRRRHRDDLHDQVDFGDGRTTSRSPRPLPVRSPAPAERSASSAARRLAPGSHVVKSLVPRESRRASGPASSR